MARQRSKRRGNGVMQSGSYRAEIVSTERDFDSLAGEWDELYARARDPRPSMSFDWSKCSWETIARPRGAPPDGAGLADVAPGRRRRPDPRGARQGGRPAARGPGQRGSLAGEHAA